MSMQSLIDAVSRRLGYLPPVAREVTVAVTRELADVIAKGDAVRVPGLGLFTTKRVPGMTVTHPTTGKKHKIAEHRLPVLRASADLKRRVRRGR